MCLKSEKHFQNTKKILKQAMGNVFQAYAVGVFFKNQSFAWAQGCRSDSLFDLASLTKVICTTTLYAIAEDKKILSIGEKLQDFFPPFPDERTKLSHLLNHSSGLAPWLPLHESFHEEARRDPLHSPSQARMQFEEEILTQGTENLEKNFEKEMIYSDLGFMLLGWVLEKKENTTLDALFQEWVSLPLKLRSIQFLPTSPNIVPTEDCPWRGHVLRGEVHDDNCYVLGGVAGHAGLFGNVKDVLKFGVTWLNALSHNTEIISQTTAQKFWNFTHIAGSARRLGWDGVSSQNSSTGKHLSHSTRGHLGYTGTSLWIDPEKNLVVTLLTNRVHPSRENEKIKAFRPRFHDTLLEELGF